MSRIIRNSWWLNIPLALVFMGLMLIFPIWTPPLIFSYVVSACYMTHWMEICRYDLATQLIELDHIHVYAAIQNMEIEEEQ